MAEAAYLKKGSVETDDDSDDEDTKNTPMSCVVLDHPVEGISGWIDHYDEDDSTRGNTNPKSHLRPSSTCSISLSGVGSQRFSGPIVGLPQRLQHSGYLGRSTRRQRVRLFPKRKKGRHSVAVWEPTSPKVSCLGRVRSEKVRNTKTKKEKRFSLRGWFASLTFWNKSDKKSIEEEEEGEAESKRRTKEEDEEKKKSMVVAGTAAVVPVAPGLGELKRFSSGRRVELFSDDDDDDDDEDVERRSRRSLGSMDDLDPGREWDHVGPASA